MTYDFYFIYVVKPIYVLENKGLKITFYLCFRMEILRKIKYYYSLLNHINIIATIIWNFRLFPFKIALKYPILIGHNVDFYGVHRGDIILESQRIRKGMIRIGISRFPTFPSKGLHTMIRVSPNSSITFGEEVILNTGCSLIAACGGQIIIGNDVWINQCSIFYSNSEIRIGNHTRIGWKTQLYDSPVHFLIDTNTGNVSDSKRPIYVGNNVWIANHVSISAGAYIPDFTVVASHSLVNKNFSEQKEIGGLLVGIPAKYKDNKKVRLLNDSVEAELKVKYFQSKKNCVNLRDLGYNIEPFNPKSNFLYRKQ